MHIDPAHQSVKFCQAVSNALIKRRAMIEICKCSRIPSVRSVHNHTLSENHGQPARSVLLRNLSLISSTQPETLLYLHRYDNRSHPAMLSVFYRNCCSHHSFPPLYCLICRYLHFCLLQWRSPHHTVAQCC